MYQFKIPTPVFGVYASCRTVESKLANSNKKSDRNPSAQRGRRLISKVPEPSLLSNVGLGCPRGATVVGGKLGGAPIFASIHSLGYPAAFPHPPVDQTCSYNGAANHQGQIPTQVIRPNIKDRIT